MPLNPNITIMGRFLISHGILISGWNRNIHEKVLLSCCRLSSSKISKNIQTKLTKFAIKSVWKSFFCCLFMIASGQLTVTDKSNKVCTYLDIPGHRRARNSYGLNKWKLLQYSSKIIIYMIMRESECSCAVYLWMPLANLQWQVNLNLL